MNKYGKAKWVPAKAFMQLCQAEGVHSPAEHVHNMSDRMVGMQQNALHLGNGMMWSIKE